MSDRNIVDSSAWLEYFVDSDRAALFAPIIEDTNHLEVPVITIYEVYKKVLRERGESDAREASGMMQSGRVVDVDITLVIEAAQLQLPLADSLIYAVALRESATLWTQDSHFKGLAQVNYFAKT